MGSELNSSDNTRQQEGEEEGTTTLALIEEQSQLKQMEDARGGDKGEVENLQGAAPVKYEQMIRDGTQHQLSQLNAENLPSEKKVTF